MATKKPALLVLSPCHTLVCTRIRKIHLFFELSGSLIYWKNASLVNYAAAKFYTTSSGLVSVPF